jgi:hypothetical protein
MLLQKMEALYAIFLQSQSYFTTGGLQPISSSWRQVPWESRHRNFIFLSDERMDLLFTIAAGPLQHSHSQVLVPRDPRPNFTVLNSTLPQPGGPGPRIYIPEEQGGPVIPPGTRFPFRLLLRLAGLRWKYSIPPPQGNYSSCFNCPHNPVARTE